MVTKRSVKGTITAELQADFMFSLAQIHAMYAHRYREVARDYERGHYHSVTLADERAELDDGYLRRVSELCQRYGVAFDAGEFRASLESISG